MTAILAFCACMAMSGGLHAQGPAKGPGGGGMAAKAAKAGARAPVDAAQAPDGLPRWIDVHAHLRPGGGLFMPSLMTAQRALEAAGMSQMLLMPQPFTDEAAERAYDYDQFAPLLSKLGNGIVFLGGNRLNRMLAATPAERVDDAARTAFEREAEAIVKAGALGFGEIGVLHLSRFVGHPFQDTPADHPLLLLLADIAARHGKVIDLHMDVFDAEAPPPSGWPSPPNPRVVVRNTDRFERLAAHNRGAKLVLAHFGSDVTGQWSVALARRLLAAHPNVYMSIKLAPRESGNTAFGILGGVKPEWIALLREFPDRFVIGTDSFYAPPQGMTSFDPRPVWDFLLGLPTDLRERVASGNARRLYGLGAETGAVK